MDPKKLLDRSAQIQKCVEAVMDEDTPLVLSVVSETARGIAGSINGNLTEEGRHKEMLDDVKFMSGALYGVSLMCDSLKLPEQLEFKDERLLRAILQTGMRLAAIKATPEVRATAMVIGTLTELLRAVAETGDSPTATARAANEVKDPGPEMKSDKPQAPSNNKVH